MAQTAQAQVQDMIERASRLGDYVLAAEIRSFAASRQFGLVFEHNRPERMRLYGKPVTTGDVVQVLPERGKHEDDSSRLLWQVVKTDEDNASLKPYVGNGYSENDMEPCEVPLSEVVSVAEYDQPIYAGLRETGRVERGGDKPYQVVINGENYHALEMLTFAYAGKVDCIYIDPPYNSGARDWKYNNDYVGEDDAYRHSKWLAFMERRLKLAKKLLNPEDSVLIVAIDEKEYLRLGMLLAQLYPGASITMVSSVINPAGAGRGNTFFRTDEYLFFVQIGCCRVLPESRLASETPVVWDTLRRSSLANARGKHGKGACGPNQFFPIYVNDQTRRIDSIGEPLSEDESRFEVPQVEGCTAVFPVRPDGTEMNWGIKPELAKQRLEAGYLRVGKHTPDKPQQYVISYLTGGIVNDIESGVAIIKGRMDDGTVDAYYPSGRDKMPTTNWNRATHDAQRNGTNLVNKLIPGRDFPYPKSLYAVEDCLRMFLGEKSKALIIDFFAGSGTTGHATMRLNHQDGGLRTCISVTNNEISAREEKILTAQRLRKGDTEWEQRGICEYATKPRLKSAICGINSNGLPISGRYGTEIESYELDEDAQLISKKTGKPLKGLRYKKVKIPDPAVRDQFPMSDGFEENAVFYDLTYQDPEAVELGCAFEEIAPLLWLRAGAKGSIIDHEQYGFAIAESYAILFDYSRYREFIEAVKSEPGIVTAYVVTDDEGRFASVKAGLPGLDVVRLYESYLRSFRIAAEDAVR